MSDRFSRLENQASVVASTLAQTPDALVRQVADDLTNRPGQVATNSLIAGGIGYGATILMRRAPIVGALVAGTAVLAEGCRLLPKIGNFLDEAGNADSAQERQKLARQGAHGVGREGALILETLPAAGFGSKFALGALEKSAAATNLSYRFAEKVEFPLRRAIPESVFFKGPGTNIKTSLMTGVDTADALGASRLLPSPKSYSVEYGRVIDPQAGKMSWKLPGTVDSVELGVIQQPKQFSVHLQNPALPRPGVPSVSDLRAVPKDSLGIINAGENSTFFMGKGNAKIAAGADVEVQAVVLDHKMKNAFLHDYTAQAGKYELSGLQKPQRLDYDEALRALQKVNLNNPWDTLSGIARSNTPGMSGVSRTLESTANSSFGSRIKAGLNFGDGGPTFLRSVATASNPLFHYGFRSDK